MFHTSPSPVIRDGHHTAPTEPIQQIPTYVSPQSQCRFSITEITDKTYLCARYVRFPLLSVLRWLAELGLYDGCKCWFHCFVSHATKITGKRLIRNVRFAFKLEWDLILVAVFSLHHFGLHPNVIKERFFFQANLVFEHPRVDGMRYGCCLIRARGPLSV